MAMYCKNCGAQLNDDARFCNECGAPVAQPPAAVEREDNEIGGARPVNAAPAAPQPTPVPQPVPAPAYGAAQTAYPQPQAQPGGYASPQGQPAAPPAQGPTGYVPPQGQPGGYASPQGQPGGYMPPQGQPGYPPQAQPQPAYPYAAQPFPAAKPKKKSNAPVIILAVLLALAVAGVALFVVLKVFRKEPEPVVVDPTGTEIVTEKDADPATQKPDGAESTAPAANGTETTAPAAPDAPLSDTPLTDAQAKEALEKLVGFWNSPNGQDFISVTRMDQGMYYFQDATWYSEAWVVGFLQSPITGDPSGIVSMRLYFEGMDSDYYTLPAMDDDILFDLSDIGSGTLRWNLGGSWQEYHFAGSTAEEAMPPMN